jgi:hypothetical protein
MAVEIGWRPSRILGSAPSNYFGPALFVDDLDKKSTNQGLPVRPKRHRA